MNEREKYFRECLSGMDMGPEAMLAREEKLRQIRGDTIRTLGMIEDAQAKAARKLMFETYR